MVTKYYWDSVSFLAWLQNETGRIDGCRDTLDRAAAGDLLIITSTLTVTEVLWTREGPRLTRDKGNILNGFFRRSYIKLVNLDRSIAQKAQGHVWDDGIKPKDSIHLATALHVGCEVLETYDTDLLKKNGCFGNLIIQEPQLRRQGSLDLRTAESSSAHGLASPS